MHSKSGILTFKFRSSLINLAFIVICVLSLTVKAQPQGEFPPSFKELTFISDGSRMAGLAYLATGKGTHPTALLLHGYPGNEKNLDLAQALRSQGWNVIFFHYRGAWGSEGEFGFLNAEQDVQTVLSFMLDEAGAATLGIDRSKVSLIGHSMGGHMALAGTFDNPAVKCVVAIDPANLGAKDKGFFENPESTKMWKSYSDTLFMLSGWSGQKGVEEIRLHGKELNLLNRADKINGRPVMMIAANSDVIPMALHIDPLVAAFKAQPKNQLTYQLIEDDHSFSASRTKLIATTADFLNAQCR